MLQRQMRWRVILICPKTRSNMIKDDEDVGGVGGVCSHLVAWFVSVRWFVRWGAELHIATFRCSTAIIQSHWPTFAGDKAEQG